MGLKGIPNIISPDLLKVLAEMGHGDGIVLADAHFPAHSVGRKNGIPVIRLDGVTNIAELLSAILDLIDLDTYAVAPAAVMDVTEDDKAKGMKTPLPAWQKYTVVCENHLKTFTGLTTIERFEFYKEAAKSFAVVITGDTSVYANIIIKKGVTSC